MSGTKRRDAPEKLRALERSFVDDILNLSDEEILAETKEDGLDPEKTAPAMRESALALVTAARKKLLAEVRREFEKARVERTDRKRPTIDEIKRRVTELFSTTPELSLAFRKGERQSDADWESLWDDLTDMGLIKDDDVR